MRLRVSSDIIVSDGLFPVGRLGVLLVRTCLIDRLALEAYSCVEQRRMMGNNYDDF